MPGRVARARPPLTYEVCELVAPEWKLVTDEAHPGDVVTTPTPAMLEAVQSCSLLDDVFQEDPVTNDLEAYLAQRTGKEAGLFVVSGTMGNQLAMRSLLTQPPHGVVCDHRSHLFTSEAGGLVSQPVALPCLKIRD